MNRRRKVILFQGDSITDGGRSRNDDPNHVLGHGYPYIIAAQLGNEMAEEQPWFVNRGVSGDRVSDLYARWNEDAISIKPDILSMLIGVNDLWRSINGEASGVTDRFERAYRHLLEETSVVLPDTKLILCEPFILRTGATEEKWEAWKQQIRHYQQVVWQLADTYGAVHVPLQKRFDEACSRADAAYWIWDGVHPTAAGHALIADQWLSVVQEHGLIKE